MTNYKTILNREFPKFCSGKLTLVELIHTCIDDSINDTSISGRSRLNKIVDEIMNKIKTSYKLSHISIPTYDGWESGVVRIYYRGLDPRDISIDSTGLDLYNKLRELDKEFKDMNSKVKDFSDDDLKKFSPEQRQEFIINQLNSLRSKKIPSYVNVSEVATLILKAYLLDRGESIDVDFSKEYKVDDTEMWLSLLENTINEIPDHTKSLSSNTAQKGLNLIVVADDFIKLVKADLDKKNESKFKSFNSRLMRCM